MKQIYFSSKKFVHKHKEALVVSAITIPVIVLFGRVSGAQYSFIVEKKLVQEYSDWLKS